MKTVISKVFDARKSEHYRNYSGSKCKTPFTFMITIDGYVTFPYNSNTRSTCGFATQQEAERARENFRFNINNKVFVVLKNSDFTEGRGPMLIHKVFKNIESAHGYIMSQKGIYGSTQYHQINMGVNINNELYCYASYNGYDLQIMELE